jgi:hypothetical protein
LTAISALAVLGVAGAGAWSLQASASAHPAPVAWGLSPTRTEVKPGQRRFLVAVQNRGPKPLRMIADVEQASETNSGIWRFRRPDAASGASWITLHPSRFRLAPGQVRHITVRIGIPAEAKGSGQRYLGVIVRPVVSFKHLHATGVVTSAGIASEMILDVPGKVVHATGFGLQAPGFSGWGSVPVTATISNRGTAYDLLNSLAASAQGDTIRFPGILVIGGSQRTVRATWTGAPAFCLPCHITMNGASVTVWRVPLLPISGALVVLLGLIAGWSVARHRRRPRMLPGSFPDPRADAPWIADVTGTSRPRVHRPAGGRGGPIGS